MKRRLLRTLLFLVIALALLVVGVMLGSAEDGGDGDTRGTTKAGTKRATSAPDPADGEVLVEYREASEDDAASEDLVRGSKLLQEGATSLDESIELPQDVTVVFGGDPEGPYYDPEDRTIQYPWEFVTETRRLLGESGYEPDELDEATIDATRFILQHELGHALVDVLELPVLGREEDAADGFAAYVAVEFEEDGDLVIAATDLFAAFDDEAGDTIEDADFFDSHSLDRQRFFGISCLVYGADTDEYANVVDGIGAEDERLDECPAEWEQLRDGWDEVLAPYLRD